MWCLEMRIHFIKKFEKFYCWWYINEQFIVTAFYLFIIVGGQMKKKLN